MNENPVAPEATAAQPRRECLPISAEEKAQWVRRFQESGLSIRKFSDQHHIPRMSLWRWVRQAPADETAAADGSLPQFAEIKLPPSALRSDWAVELTLPNGTVLRFSRDVPPSMVDQLLRIC